MKAIWYLFIACIFCHTVSQSQCAGADTGLKPENMQAAARYSADRLGISMVVMVNGEIVFEDYPNGGFAARAHELASGTKSFSGVIAAAAVADGLLDFDEKVSDTITAWQDIPGKRDITIRQLLSLTSGLQTGSERGRVPVYADAVAAPLVDDPGTRFRYGAVPFQVFGEVMHIKLEPAGQSPLDYLKARVFTPLGISVRRWRHGADGNPHLPSGAALTARDWARFGEFVRLEGTWQGKEIIPAEILNHCFQPSALNPAYGLTWWLNPGTADYVRVRMGLRAVGVDLLSNPAIVPADLAMAAGAGCQRLYISREQKLVVVRQATGITESLIRRQQAYSDTEFLRLLLAGNLDH